jgi:hypothetical protein
MKVQIINKFNNTTLYKFTLNGLSANCETERIKDRKGTLLRSETTYGFFECYGISELKSFMLKNLNN